MTLMRELLDLLKQVAVLGPSGCGKSTMLAELCGEGGAVSGVGEPPGVGASGGDVACPAALAPTRSRSPATTRSDPTSASRSR